MRVHVHKRVPVRVYVNARVCERKMERGGGLSGGKGEGTMGSCGKGGLECMDGALGVCVFVAGGGGRESEQRVPKRHTGANIRQLCLCAKTCVCNCACI